ncbi:MAG: hypothetical protein E6G97_02060 [Alphaproteobacteria bacterium]|nr:MAG: hypothetical protein E6G97_02060 [Alphaproteobacteria bacterium]
MQGREVQQKVSPSMAVMSAEASVSAADFLLPPSMPHYETDERVVRIIPLKNLLWSVTFFSEHDGIGWRVRRCEVRPADADEIARFQRR